MQVETEAIQASDVERPRVPEEAQVGEIVVDGEPVRVRVAVGGVERVRGGQGLPKVCVTQAIPELAHGNQRAEVLTG